MLQRLSIALGFLLALIRAEPALAKPGSDNSQPISWFLQDTSIVDRDIRRGLGEARWRGWDYLATKLIGDGVPEERVAQLFSLPQFPKHEPVPFSIAPKESHTLYSGFFEEPTLSIARVFLTSNADAFMHAERRFGVARSTVAALLLVETQCGRIVGTNQVAVRIARVASVAEPETIEFNIARLTAEDPTISADQVRARAQYLEATFYPELKALFEVTERLGVSLLDLRGSSAGAFGIPQFMPSSYLRFAVDGDGDAVASLFEPADAILSAANFLHSFGWRDTASEEDKLNVLWNYNRSDAYGAAVLKVSELLSAAPRIETKKFGPGQRSKSSTRRSTVRSSAKNTTVKNKSGGYGRARGAT